MSEERLKEIKEELAKISFSNIGHCVNTNLILDYITNLQEEIERLHSIIKEVREILDSIIIAVLPNNQLLFAKEIIKKVDKAKDVLDRVE